ncbi:MAG: class I SAM-dependent methyltransferase, partial [Candidatus Nomurabacteria bacterium]|nr:class I SAM-dependent methyltransferase [Candidatus Nomurabacteria bacterium]
MIKIIKKIYIRFVKKLNYIGSGLSMRLVKWTGKHDTHIHPKHLIEKYPEYIKYFKSDDIVLDIGCDHGGRSFLIAPHVGSVDAFDYNQKRISQAQKEQQRRNIANVTFSVLSAEDQLPFSDDSFTKIFFYDVIEHLYNRDQIVSECFRLLKSGGQLLVTAPNKNTPWKNFQKSVGLPYYADADHKIEYDQQEIESKLVRHGFTIESIKPIVYDTPWKGMIDLVGGI